MEKKQKQLRILPDSISSWAQYLLGLFLSSRTFQGEFLFLFLNKFIYLFLAALGVRCRARAFSGCGEWGLLFVAVCRLLTVVASLVEHGL